MSKRKNKRYLPDEFKPEYWRGRGVTQIVIGIGITVCGIFHKQNVQSVVFIIGGIAWTIFGVVLVVLDSKGKQENEQQSNKAKKDKNNTDKDAVDDYDDGL